MINLIREKQERKKAQLEKYQSMLMKTKNKTPWNRYNSFKNKNEIILNNLGGQEINYSQSMEKVIKKIEQATDWTEPITELTSKTQSKEYYSR